MTREEDKAGQAEGPALSFPDKLSVDRQPPTQSTCMPKPSSELDVLEQLKVPVELEALHLPGS